MNPRPLGPEPSALPNCATPRSHRLLLAAALPVQPNYYSRGGGLCQFNLRADFCFFTRGGPHSLIFPPLCVDREEKTSRRHQSKQGRFLPALLRILPCGDVVEVTGLEPTTSWSLTKRATKLRYTSVCFFGKQHNLLYMIFRKSKTILPRFSRFFYFLPSPSCAAGASGIACTAAASPCFARAAGRMSRKRREGSSSAAASSVQ